MKTTQKSWVPVSKGSGFGLENLPLGVFSTSRRTKRAGVALGKHIIDLAVLQDKGFLDELRLPRNVFATESLNDFLHLGKLALQQLRTQLQALFSIKDTQIQHEHTLHESLLVPLKEATLHLPVQVGDYTDFYSSIEHASNVGSLFRDPSNPLLPNWRHLPVAYHGRASSIISSGTPVRRPIGQRKPPQAEHPLFGPSTQLDFELEMAFVSCGETELGTRIPVEEAEKYIAGFVLFNDWSARDIQAWEYVPLGPFLGKNFASSISPWIVTLEALKPFRTQSPIQDPTPLPYLQVSGSKNFDIHLTADLKAKELADYQTITRTNFKYLYWNINQQLAHHTVGGCSIRAGDMCASGTISGKEAGSFGSMLELSWRGQKPLALNKEIRRSFLEDGDVLRLTGCAQKGDLRIDFGEVSGEILPAQ